MVRDHLANLLLPAFGKRKIVPGNGQITAENSVLSLRLGMAANVPAPNIQDTLGNIAGGFTFLITVTIHPGIFCFIANALVEPALARGKVFADVASNQAIAIHQSNKI